jgi:uncharacterized protein
VTATSLVERVVALADDLRAAGVDASIAEALDGVEAMGHLDIADRPLLRAGLQATLVKRSEDREVFAVLFERHFPLSPLRRDTTARSVAEVVDALVEALRAGDESALAELAGEAVEAFAGMENQDGGERYFLYRVMRALDLSNLLIAVMNRQRSLDPSASASDLRDLRDDVRERLERYRKMLAAEVRRGTGLVAARRIEDLDVTSASTTELRQLRAAVRPLARKLASRIGQQRRRHRRGRLDVRRTLRRSLDAGGTPLDPVFRKARPTKPRLVVLCDISGSVAEFAHFTLMLLHALQAELAGLRSFVFVDGVAEVTTVLERAEVTLDPRLLVTLPGVVAVDGHSDYERALATFVERHADALRPEATVLVAGDARTNYRGSGIESLRTVRRRCRRLYWFNPEPEHEWGDTDSELHTYRELCDGVFEVRSLAQLADAVAAII